MHKATQRMGDLPGVLWPEVDESVRGPVRVEVGVAVWSLSLDHGPRTATLTVLALSALSAMSAMSVRDPGKVALTVTGTVVAVLLTINGVLGL